MSKRRQSRRRQDDSIQWVERLWTRLVNPTAIGGLVVLAGLVTLFAPTVAISDPLREGWWGTAFHFDDATRAAAAFVAAAAVLGAGLIFSSRSSRPDVVEAVEGPRRPNSWRSRLPLIGLALMVVAVAGESFFWWAGQAKVPVSRVSLPVGQKVESYPAIDVTRTVKVMLPHRVQLSAIEEGGSATLLFSTASKPDEPIEEILRPNEPIDVDGFRYALLGVEYDERMPRAVLESGKENSIPATGGIGATVQFEVDGPIYTLRQVVRDYLSAMGPAIELESEEAGRFWVFQRANPLGDAFDSPDQIRLVRLETGPVAVLSVSPASELDVTPAFALIFIIGLGLFFGVDDRRRVDGGVSSLNAASSLKEEVA